MVRKLKPSRKIGETPNAKPLFSTIRRIKLNSKNKRRAANLRSG
jgi:hypothetical protein